jgi:peptidyl-prolyl cis-trans isomerase A (cyclophilin A)
MLPRALFLCGLAAFSLSAMGCPEGGAANSKDPPIPTVDSKPTTVTPKEGPAQYWVKLETTKGDVIIEVTRTWSPYAADRFYELVSSKYFDNGRFFRVVSGYVVQFGINGDPAVNAQWASKQMPDDRLPPGRKHRPPNARGTITFAKAGPNSRTTQVFINYKSNPELDTQDFTPFGKVVQGMAAIDSLYDGYAEEPMEIGSVHRFNEEGNAYLDNAFPRLDSIKKATILPGKPNLPSPPAG